MRRIVATWAACAVLVLGACSDDVSLESEPKTADTATADTGHKTDVVASGDGQGADSGSPHVDPAIACQADGDCGPRGWCDKGGCRVRWAIDVEAGRHFSCVRLGLGGYSCWGRNEWAQLGDGTKKTRAVPNKPRLANEHLRGLATGSYHACVLADSGAAQCWGRDTVGQATGVQGKSILWPALVGASTLRKGVSVHAGYQHSCGLGIDGYATCWGSRTYAQTGGRAMPRAAHRVPYVAGLEQLDVANVYSCGVKAGGVWCWGSNSNGQIGNGRTAHHEAATRVIGIDDAVEVATGSRHACALSKKGTVKCWGKGTDGQLGNGPAASSSLPVAVTAIADVVQLDASPYHTCARDKSGGAWCWGANKYGQLGTEDTARRTQPVKIAGITDAIDIAAGFWHTCVVHRDGRVSCWGRNEYGTIGIGTASKKSELKPRVVKAEEAPCESDQACANASDPCIELLCDPATNRCASKPAPDAKTCLDGDDACGLTGVCKAGVCELKDGCDDGDVCTAPVCKTGGACGHEPAIQACGDGKACSIAAWCDGATCKQVAKSCDDGNACTLDVCGKDGACSSKPVIDASGCEDDNACTENDACKAGVCVGEKRKCGHGCHPEAGCLLSDKANAFAAKYELAAGDDFTCAVGSGGHTLCWGLNDHGQVGTGKVGGVVFKPALLAGGVTGIDVHAGDDFACLRQDDGDVACWGRNDAGQLGTGKTGAPSATATFIKGLTTRDPLALGRQHGCAIVSGRVWCWGSDVHGQLGGSFGGIKGPVLVPGVPVASFSKENSVSKEHSVSKGHDARRSSCRIAAGADTTCMISRGRRVFCWGRCEGGVCGRGGTSKGKVRQVRFLRSEGAAHGQEYDTVAVGNGFACAMNGDRTVCWGRGQRGQLGSGAFGGSEIPRRVRLRPAALWLVAGGEHACTLGRDERAWPTCWGSSTSGQLGIGSTKSRPWAVKPRSVGAAIRVAAGRRHTCWTTAAGTIRCAGYNGNARLGVGSKKTVVTSPGTVKFAAAKLPNACTIAVDCGAKGVCDESVACEHGRCIHRPRACPSTDSCSLSRCDPVKGCVIVAVADAEKVACEDDKECAAATCAGGSCKTSAPCPAVDKVSGKVTFDWIPALATNEGGIKLGYDKTEVRPARRIVVQAVAMSSAATVLDETTTDTQGAYTLQVPKGTKVKVRALAHLRIDDTVTGKPRAWADIRAVDNTNEKAQWALVSPQVSAPKSGVNLHAATKWDAKKSGHTVRQSGPFALMDTTFDVVQLVRGQDMMLPALHINWSPGNMPLPGYKDQGQIGPSSHYTTELGMPVIYLKGFENINTDEYDDHIVAHEVGHHVENALFRSDSIGGRHSSYNSLDGRIAFGEGYANALSAMALKDPIYVNVSGKNQKGGFQLDFSAPITSNDRGTYSEKAVAWLLVKLWDGRDKVAMSGKFDRIRWTLEHVHEPTDTFTSLLRFVHGYHARYGDKVDGDDIKELFTVDLDTPMPLDRWDTGNAIGAWYAAKRTYPQGFAKHRGAQFWRGYRTLKAGVNEATAHDQLVLGGYTYPHNKLGGSRWYRLKGTGKAATVAVEKPLGAKCVENTMDLRAYRLGRAIKWDVRQKGEFAGCPKVTFPTTAGYWYLLDVRTTPTNNKDIAGWTMRVTFK